MCIRDSANAAVETVTDGTTSGGLDALPVQEALPDKNYGDAQLVSANEDVYKRQAMSWTIPVFIRTRSWPNGKGLWKNRKLTSRKTTNNTIQV